MKATDILNKAKELLSLEAEEVKLAEMKLENGTILEAEDFAEGKEIFIVTEDEKVALPVGDYILEDGQQLKVEEEGIIASIGEAEEAEEAPEEIEVEAEEVSAEYDEEEKEEMEYATKQELSEIREMVEEIKAMISDKEEMSAEEKAEEAVEDIVEEVKEELSVIEKVKHNPEANTQKDVNLFAQKKPASTLDRVFGKFGKF